MAQFRQSLTFIDAYSRKTTRSYDIEAADYTAARVIGDANLLAVTNLTVGGIVKDELASVTYIASAAGAAANVDTGATFAFNLVVAGKQASISFPMIDPTVINADSSVDLVAATVAAWTANYTSGDIKVSDGETVATVKSAYLDK